MKVGRWLLLMGLAFATGAVALAQDKPDDSKISKDAIKVLKDRQEVYQWYGTNPWGELEYAGDKSSRYQNLLPVIYGRPIFPVRETPDLGTPFGLMPAHPPFPEVRFHAKDVLHLKNLLMLDLTGVRTDVDDLKELAKLKSLRILHLQTGSDELFERLKKCEGLTHLYCLGSGKVTVQGIRSLMELKNLKSLVLIGARMLTDDDLKEVARMKGLTHLNLSYTECTDAGVKHLGQLPDLAELNVGRARGISANVLKDLKGLKDLRALDLTNATKMEEGLKELQNFKKLRALRIQSNLNDAGLRILSELKSLEYLDVRGGPFNKISDEGIAELKKALPRCQVWR